MSFDKSILKKVASEVRASGVESAFGKDLLKKASDTRIAYLTALIKNLSK